MNPSDQILKNSSKHQWPKISLVLGNYNYGQWVERALTSVLDQKYPNLELFVIDDGSTDNSVEVLGAYNQYFSYWNPRNNQGHYSWIKEASDRATGDLFGWLCSDDYLAPQSLERIGRAFRDSASNLITGTAIRWGKDGEFQNELKPFIPKNFQEIFEKGLGLAQPTTFIRTDLFRKALPPPGLVNILVDTATYLRFWMQNEGALSVSVIPEIIAHVQNHPDAQTVSQGLRTKEEIKKIYSFMTHESDGVKKQLLEKRYKAHQLLDEIENRAADSNCGVASVLALLKRNPQAIFARPFWGAVKKKILGSSFL